MAKLPRARQYRRQSISVPLRMFKQSSPAPTSLRDKTGSRSSCTFWAARIFGFAGVILMLACRATVVISTSPMTMFSSRTDISIPPHGILSLHRVLGSCTPSSFSSRAPFPLLFPPPKFPDRVHLCLSQTDVNSCMHTPQLKVEVSRLSSLPESVLNNDWSGSQVNLD
jgi:hypothetical protein